MKNLILETQKDVLVSKLLTKAITYKEYREMVAQNVANETSSANYPSEALSNYTLLNNSRMKRLDKTLKIPEKIKEKFENFSGNQTWLVLTESWCGDAAHSMPVMNKLSELSSGITLKVLYRDRNLDLMQHFLTNGSMSIPILIVFDNEKEIVVGQWGPSPSYVLQKTKAFKEKHGKLTPEFKKEMQLWYNKDKGQTIAEDLLKLIDK